MRIFRERSTEVGAYVLGSTNCVRISRPNAPGVCSYRDGSEYCIECLRCKNPRCMVFAENEVKCGEVEDFPRDNSLNVCPVDALSIGADGIPTINYASCISCGVCIKRCPIGALYFNENGEPQVNTEPSGMVVHTDNKNAVERQVEQVERLLSVPHSGYFLRENDAIMAQAYEKLMRLSSQYHNIVVRNILIALGCKSAMRRVGDIYTRMDAIYSSSNGAFGTVEVEFGRDTLSASRGILDDIAILYTRYGINKNMNNPLVVCLQLPNERQGYWQVVKDIKNVLDIRINTITVGALMLLLWGGYEFLPEGDKDPCTGKCQFLHADQYYIDFDNMKLRDKLCYQMDTDTINLTEGELGILEPMK